MRECMGKILIIEDEEKIARFVELELEFEGYEVEKAFDGRSGLELVKTRSFDLVLLDIMLPG
jgi:two-component system response regulator ArlR